ncbi:MAG: VOC family protein [Rhodospirillales bacterium]|jgi:catechol 2,3-dioxygenase-like lactoylglutathione lyase family enzyme|nr:glyoxalase [Rhodospirillaceae bacterium]MDP6429141.1 VOC family protein [Rhodospirillales bacterium]MDP6645675.1 VOC family protein [Rhodospirillales bacterium]|tara:strand:- start:62 stop:628 length:567 start_codon:yes stop_codon:yes gene_type:complete
MTQVPQLQFGHIAIAVVDLDRMIDFYTGVLGYFITDRGVTRPGGPELVYMSRDPKDHHQVVLASGRPDGLPSQIAQLSFRVGSLAELRCMYEIVRHAQAPGIRTLAHGIAWSLYFQDPEENTLETFVASPWYLPAPVAFPFDFDEMSDGEIFESTRAEVQARPDYKSFTDWQAGVSQAMLDGGHWNGA